MKLFAWGLLAALVVSANSGCCCLWQALHAGNAWPGHCGNGCTDSHYLDPHGAQYHASCAGNCGGNCGGTSGACCEVYGCGEKYYSDYHVPYQPDPCDCCGNWTGHGPRPAYQMPSHYGPGGYSPGYVQHNSAVPSDEEMSHPLQYGERQVGPTKVVDGPAPTRSAPRSIARPTSARPTPARPTSARPTSARRPAPRGNTLR